MLISLIAAASENNVIGKDNRLLWRLPNDTKFFKNTTWGMPVIMGRKTYDSLNGEPLLGRFNIVITRQEHWKPLNKTVQVALSLDQAIQLAAEEHCKEAFVIGGGKVYAEAIGIADKIYLTRVHTTVDGDAFFPAMDATRWSLVSNKDFPADDRHSYAYSFQTWVRTKR